jgi:hypothetical protein
MKSDDTTEDKILDLTKSIHNLFKLLGSDSSLRQINHLLTQYSQQAKIDCIIENGGDTPTDLKVILSLSCSVISVAFYFFLWLFFFTYALLAGLRFTLAEDRFFNTLRLLFLSK